MLNSGASSRPGWLVLGLIFLVSLPAVTPRIYASDEIEYFAHLRSIWFDRDLSFENEYRYFYDRGVATEHLFHETFLERTTPTGRRMNFTPVGCAILWAPFYAAGDLVARALHAAGQPVAIDGYSAPYIAAISYGSAFYGFAAVMLSWIVAKRLVGRGGLAALAVWLGTPLLFYTYVAPPMSHAVSAFTVAAFTLTWLNVRQTWSTRGLVGLGALAALMTMVREQDAFFVVAPGVDLLWTIARMPRRGDQGWPAVYRLLAGVIAGSITFAVVFIPQALAYVALNGRLWPAQEVERKMSWQAPHALEVVMSPEHGLLAWTPLAAIAMLGLFLLVYKPRIATVPDARRIAVCLLLAAALQIYVSGSVESWTSAGAFGQRRFVALTVVLTIGLAALFTAVKGPVRAVTVAAVVMAIWWNLGLMAQFGTGMMDRQRLQLASNAYNTFVTVPARLPNLVYRYFFDRSSFYRNSERLKTEG